MKRILVTTGVLTLSLIARLVPAADWPMFGRDSTRNAVSPEKNPPLEWDIKSGKNIKWKAKLGSMSLATPVVANGLVWIGTNNGNPRDPGDTNAAGVLMCFRERDGKFVYQHVSSARQGPTYRQAQTGISCSPLIEGDRLWFVTTRAEIISLDIGPLHRSEEPPMELWKLDMVDELGVSPRPAVMGGGGICSIGASYRDFIYVITGNGTDLTSKHIPSPNAPALVCLAKDTGKVVWEDHSSGSNILFGEWGIPLVIDLEGRGQIVAPQGDGWVRSFDALTGELIWKFDINPKDGKWPETRWFFSTAPVFYRNRIYVALGTYLEFGEGLGRLVCLDPTKPGDISMELDDGTGKGKPNPNSGAIWHFDQIHRTMSTVAIHKGLVIAPDFAGFVYCLDADTGQMYWRHDLRAPIYNSPLIADDKVFVANEDGQVCVLALAKEKQVLAERLGSETWISGAPVLANDVLYLVAGDTLLAIEEQTGDWPQWRGVDRESAINKPGPAPRTVAIEVASKGTETAEPRSPRTGRDRAPDAIYVTTPEDVVERMLELAAVKREDVVFDLGSGDGRIVIAAAKKYGCHAVGYEIDPKLVNSSRETVVNNELKQLVRIEHADMFTIDLTNASVVALYLPTPLLQRLLPQLEKLKPGSRIVSHQFEIPGLKPDQVITFLSKEDGDQHRLFLWTVKGSSTH